MNAGKKFSFVILAFLIVFFCGCFNFGLEEAPPEDLKKIDYKIYGFDLEFYNFGELSWKFIADTVIVPIAGEFNYAYEVEVEFYKHNEMTSRLSADYGEYYILSGNLIADGNVVVESTDNDKLLTSKLWWMEAVEEFWTDREVEIIRVKDRSRLRGLRLKADRRLKYIEIDVHLGTQIYKPEEEDGTGTQ
ncbi:MAG TPA: LPS export ABC transporter periplasmic protein LptC [Firmicutes bacterium]|nr:LPS export ABC transporter periplasmic protein LptC [Bacillota bacterium]